MCLLMRFSGTAITGFYIVNVTKTSHCGCPYDG